MAFNCFLNNWTHNTSCYFDARHRQANVHLAEDALAKGLHVGLWVCVYTKDWREYSRPYGHDPCTAAAGRPVKMQGKGIASLNACSIWKTHDWQEGRFQQYLPS